MPRHTNKVLRRWEVAFANVGFFIPPYVQMQGISYIASEIERAGLSDNELEYLLGHLFGANDLAAMILHRYGVAPVIRDYVQTIREAVEAHFLGLHHVAVSGLAPVVEGASFQLAAQRGVRVKHVKDTLHRLVQDCARDSEQNNIGASDEVASMMASFDMWIRDHFFEGSAAYPANDGTNRNGILHGEYSDAGYGRPLNFYKVISAIDFLTFIASFRAPISWMAPDHTEQSVQLGRYFEELARVGAHRPAT